MTVRAGKRGAVRAEAAADTDETPANTALDDIEDELEESMAVDLQSALAECGDTGQVRIQVIKISPKEEAGACTTYDSAELSIDRVRDEYGAGTFHLMFRNPKGQLLTRKRLSIVGKKVEAAKPATTQDLAKLLEGGNSAGSNNQMLLMMKMLEMQGAQMVAMLTRPAPAVPSTPPMGPAEIIAMMTGLASIMKPANAPDSPMDALLKGVKLANELRGDSDDNGGIVGMISKGLDVIPGLMQGGAAHGNTQLPSAPSPTRVELRQIPPSAPVEVVPTFQGKDASENDMLAKLVWLRGRVVYLLEKARANKDPALYADLFLDELPAFVTLQDIREQMSNPTWFTQLCGINRECEQFEEWLTEFRDSIMESFADAQANGADPVAPTEPESEGTNTTDECTPLN